MSGLPRQFATFLGVGGIATLCHYGVLIALVETGALGPVAGSALGALVGAVVSYVLNRWITFATTLRHRRTIPRFFAIAALAVLCNTALMAVLTGSAGLPYLPAQIITTGLIVILTFGANRFWTFRE